MQNSSEYVAFAAATIDTLRVTPDERARIRNAEQGSDAWLGYRRGRLTASNFGAAAGHNKFCTTRELLKRMLWPPAKFERTAAMQHGTRHEPVAREAYQAWMLEMTDEDALVDRIEFAEPGLTVSLEVPWLAMSPDGELKVHLRDQPTWAPSVARGLIEYKCPFRDRPYMNPSIPDYYFDQMQGQMAIDGRATFCDFVVWTSKEIVVRRVGFDADYWTNELFPALRRFYFDEFLPRLFLKSRRKLREGEIDPVEPLAASTCCIASAGTSPTHAPAGSSAAVDENDEDRRRFDTDAVHRRLAALYGGDLSHYPASIVVRPEFDADGHVEM